MSNKTRRHVWVTLSKPFWHIIYMTECSIVKTIVSVTMVASRRRIYTSSIGQLGIITMTRLLIDSSGYHESVSISNPYSIRLPDATITF